MINWIISNGEQILISIISGILLVILVFLLFRPWLYISSKISHKDGVYKFKIINFTLVKCTDLHIYLREVKEKDAYPKGKDAEYRLLPVHSSSFIYISGSITGVCSRHRPNCIQIKVDDQDLNSLICNHGTYLELIVNVRHGISNLQTTKKRTFKHEEYVTNGKWESGFSTKII